MRVPKIAFVFDRRHVASRTKKGTVDIRIAYGGKQKVFSTGVSVLPSQWNKKGECVIQRADAIMLNKALLDARLRCLDVVNEMVEEGKGVDLARLNAVMKPAAFNETFIEYIERRMAGPEKASPQWSRSPRL